MADPKKKKNVFSVFGAAKKMKNRRDQIDAAASGKSVDQLRRERMAKEMGADLQEK